MSITRSASAMRRKRRDASCWRRTGRNSSSTSRRCGPFAIRSPTEVSTERPHRQSQSAIRAPIEALARGGSPVFDSIKGYPSHVDPGAASTMKDAMAESAAFQGEIRAVRALPYADRMSRAKALAEELMQASRHRDDRARRAAAAQGLRRYGRRLALDHRFHWQACGGSRRSRRGSRNISVRACQCRPAQWRRSQSSKP